jgi:hypothetical protein
MAYILLKRLMKYTMYFLDLISPHKNAQEDRYKAT